MKAILTSALGGQIKIDGKKVPDKLLDGMRLISMWFTMDVRSLIMPR